MFGRGDRVPRRCVDHNHTGLGRRVDINVIDTNTGPTNHPQPFARPDHLGGDTGAAADQQSVKLSDHFDQLLRGEASLNRDFDIRCFTQWFQTNIGQRIADQDFIFWGHCLTF